MNAADIDLNTYPAPQSGTVGRLVEGGAVVVITETGKIQVLNEVGARIWTLADGTRTVQEIVAQISTEYIAGGGRVEADTRVFLSKMADRGALSFNTESERA